MGRRGPHEGSIYQRADGLWVGAVHLGYRDGKRRRKVVYGRTRRAVQEELVAIQRSLQQGLPVPAERQTVAQFLDRWLVHAVRPCVRPRTLQSYRQIVELHLAPGLGRLQLATLSPDDVQAFLNEKHAAGLSPRTVQYLRAVLRQALNRALRWGLVARNAAALADAPRVARTELAPFDPEEARRFLDAVRGDRLEALYTLALAAGLRQGEALGLRWSDVELEAGTVTVRHALSRIEGRLQLVEPKTVWSRRVVAVPAVAVAALRRQRARQLEERILAGSRWREGNFVFTTSIGTPLDGPTVTRRFKALLATARLRPQRFHDLRHATASLLLAQGVPARVVMETLGHSDVRLTLNTYSHVVPALGRQAAERMEELLSAGAQGPQAVATAGATVAAGAVAGEEEEDGIPA